MGGFVCQILVNAKLTFNSVPTDLEMLRLFDEQIRDIHFNTEYALAIVNETDDEADVCAILAKQKPVWSVSQWTHAERQKLLDVKVEICGPYKPGS